MKLTTILNVDDSQINRYIRTQVLLSAGYHVVEAATGKDALERIAAERPHLVLLDMNLPDMNGTEVCRSIKSRPDAASVMVVHISATQTTVEDRVFGLEEGADGYLVEPVEPDLLLATVRSMLRLRQLEAQLEQSLTDTQNLAAKYQSLVEAVPHVIFTSNTDGDWTYLSEQFSAYTGLSKDEALKAGWLELLHAADRDRVAALWTHALVTGEPFEAECRVRYNDFSHRWNVARARPVRMGGLISQWVGSVTDVHERRVLESEIQLRHREFVALAEHSPDIISRLDRTLRYTYINSPLPGVSSLSPEQYLGKTNRELGCQESFCDRIEESCKTVEAIRLQNAFEFSYKSDEGKIGYYQARVVPEFDREGSIESFLTIISDFTERRNAEMAAAESERKLRRSNEDLEQFAYAASHDLQEPLRTVTIYSELLARQLKAEPAAQGAKFVGIIQDAAGRMLRLIQDLLVFSQAQSVELSRDKPVPAADLVKEAVENLKSAIEESGAVISYDNLPAILVDGAQFTAVFQNLISNSIKYRAASQLPRIVISAEQLGTSWIFAVRDNGMGFEQAQAERIFGHFKRLHGKDIPGTGIGLAIVKRIVERHDGQVWAESKPGRGATFYLRLPVSAAGSQGA